ncbi:MAG: elongation factor G [Dehalococcoidales bacterium]
MAQTEDRGIRNVVLLSHGGAGKTSLAEAALFAAGAINRMGRVDEGNTISDYDPDEIKRKISLSLALLPCQWRGTKINLLDTPGYLDFVGEVKAAIRVAEGAVVIVSAASAVEVGTEQVWSYSQEAALARLVFVNKMDRENANFLQAVSRLQSVFGASCLPLQLPIGSHDDFTGIVDLLSLKAFTGDKAEEGEIPPTMAEEVATWREKLVEVIAEMDDNLIEKYLGGEELSQEELSKGLRQAVAEGKVVPVLAGSALKSIGISQLLDTVSNLLPAPAESEVTAGDDVIDQSQEAPLAALVFKTTADPYVGKLTYFRVYGGTINSNSHVWNVSREGDERLGQLFMVRGKTQEPVERVAAGDIGAVAKLALASTGDTLGSQDKPLKLAPIKFPSPIFSQAVHPKTKADLDKLGTALHRLAEEDPTLQVRREADTNETVIAGMGITQLEAAAEKMQHKFGVGVALSLPRVPYKETITAPAEAEYKHRKQSGGHGQFGHVFLKLEPLPGGSASEFISKIVGGSIPKNYIPAVEKGVLEGTQEGILAGYPVVNIKTTLYDGSFHPVDSSDICFKIAGAGAFKRGMEAGQPILLEPIMNIRITVPTDFTGDVIGDMNTKRAHVQGMNPEDGVNIIEAKVPLAEILRYAIDLKSLTHGRGQFTMEFNHYEQVPAHLAQKLIEEKQAEKA